MSAHEIITTAHQAGITLALNGDRLHWTASCKPSDELLQQIRGSKLEIIRYLKDTPTCCLHLLVLESGEVIQHFADTTAEALAVEAKVRHGLLVARVVPVPNATRALASYEVEAALAGNWTPSPPLSTGKAVLARTAALLGVDAGYLLKHGFVTYDDAFDLAGADPEDVARLIRSGEQWHQRPAYTPVSKEVSKPVSIETKVNKWVAWIDEQCSLLPDDRRALNDRLRGLPRNEQQELAQYYVQTWRKAAGAEPNPSGKNNAGRRAANLLITRR